MYTRMNDTNESPISQWARAAQAYITNACPFSVEPGRLPSNSLNKILMRLPRKDATAFLLWQLRNAVFHKTGCLMVLACSLFVNLLRSENPRYFHAGEIENNH